MTQEVKLTEFDATFEEKVYVIADEVLHILKELSSEHKQQISSKQIAERMFWRKSVKDILRMQHDAGEQFDIQDDSALKSLAEVILNKFQELVPKSLMNDIAEIKDTFRDDISKGDSKWIESPINIIKKYIDSLSLKYRELEEFVIQTMQYIAETENHFTTELSAQHKKFNKDNKFHNTITTDVNYIKSSVTSVKDIGNIKIQLINKIDNINKSIDEKREYDMHRLKETEQTIETMSNRMAEIKYEADEIRKRSYEIEYEAVRDTLTGLHNRKAYNDRLRETLAHVSRYDITASLMICDIDYFKKINDTHGHKVGDLALKKLASLLQERLRANDFITRFGGEEFAIILPHTDLKGAETAAEGIRAYIDNAVFSYKGREIPLTISVGVSTFTKTDNEDSVFERADRALYLAKHSGRNSVKTEEDISRNEDDIERDD